MNPKPVCTCRVSSPPLTIRHSDICPYHKHLVKGLEQPIVLEPK